MVAGRAFRIVERKVKTMKQKLTFEIECGEKTCASEPRKFCRYCSWNMKGVGTCFFFIGQLEKKDGWLMRHPDCIKEAVNNE